MEDKTVHLHIESLVAAEHQLLEHRDRSNLSAEDVASLESIEVELDRYWDLLRQRRARRDAGQDPGATELRSAATVEKYEQ